MTAEDQDAAVGRLVARYSEAKKRRAALLSEALQLSDTFTVLADGLRGLEFYTDYWSGRHDGHARDKKELVVKPYPEYEKIRMFIDDLKATAAELRELRQLMKDANVDLD